MLRTKDKRLREYDALCNVYLCVHLYVFVCEKSIFHAECQLSTFVGKNKNARSNFDERQFAHSWSRAPATYL